MGPVKKRRRGRPRNAPSRDVRRRKLLDAALTVIRRDGPTTSMGAIAAEAGVTKPVLYAHFGDKAGLSAAIARHVADELVESITGTLAEASDLPGTIRASVEAFVDFVEADPELFSFLLYPSGGRSPDEDLRSLIETLAGRIEANLGPEDAASGVPPPVALRIRAVLGLAYTSVDWWIRDGRESMGRDELVETLTALAVSVFAETGLVV